MLSIKVNSKILTSFFSLALMLTSYQTSALETNLQLHKADQSGAFGYSLGVGDSFFKQKAFNWAVSYNRLADVNIFWNNEEINFDIDTLDASLTYRYSPKSYNSFIKSLTFELHAGAGVTLTENKFTWPELDQEKYFSEQGDINPVVGFTIYKKFAKQFSLNLGVKHYPSYSEFGDVSSLFLGITYTIGRQLAY